MLSQTSSGVGSSPGSMSSGTGGGMPGMGMSRPGFSPGMSMGMGNAMRGLGRNSMAKGAPVSLAPAPAVKATANSVDGMAAQANAGNVSAGRPAAPPAPVPQLQPAMPVGAATNPGMMRTAADASYRAYRQHKQADMMGQSQPAAAPPPDIYADSQFANPPAPPPQAGGAPGGQPPPPGAGGASAPGGGGGGAPPGAGMPGDPSQPGQQTAADYLPASPQMAQLAPDPALAGMTQGLVADGTTDADPNEVNNQLMVSAADHFGKMVRMAGILKSAGPATMPTTHPAGPTPPIQSQPAPNMPTSPFGPQLRAIHSGDDRIIGALRGHAMMQAPSLDAAPSQELLQSAGPQSAATPAMSPKLASFLSRFAKRSWQDNSAVRTSAVGEGGVGYGHRSDDYDRGPAAWANSAKYLHNGGKGTSSYSPYGPKKTPFKPLDSIDAGMADKQAFVGGAIIGGVAGGLAGHDRGNTAEGIGRGVIRGGLTDLGAQLGGFGGVVGGDVLARAFNYNLRTPLVLAGGLAGAGLGGYLGWKGSGKLVGPPRGADGHGHSIPPAPPEKKETDKQASFLSRFVAR